MPWKQGVRTDPLTFKWPVQEQGYEWVEGFDSRPHLVGRDDIGSRIYLREPLKNQGLFREFSELKPTQDAIREFANRYGDLFDRYDMARDGVPRRKGTTMPLENLTGASFQRWRQEIGDMRGLVSIWDAISDRRSHESRSLLEGIIAWANNGGVRYMIRTPKMTQQAWLATPEAHEPDLLKRFRKADVFEPACYVLQREVNRRIGTPGILSSVDSELPIVPRLRWTWEISILPRRHWAPECDQRITFEPSNLLAAMWLQFAQAITGEFQLKRCPGCGKYFQAGPGGRKANAITCSNACRQRKSRLYRESSL